jgi:hypothetical protein
MMMEFVEKRKGEKKENVLAFGVVCDDWYDRSVIYSIWKCYYHMVHKT